MSYPDTNPKLWSGGIPEIADSTRPLSKEDQVTIEEAREQIKLQIKKAEEDRKKSAREGLIKEAIAHGISESALEFLEKYFVPKGHKHWDGRIGTD